MEREAALYDFALVATYLPILGLALRSSLLTSTIFWCLYTARLPFQGVLMLAGSVVYVDSLLLGTRHFDRACGHLCLCALAVLAQQISRPCSDVYSIVLLLNDLLWSVFASAEVVSSTSLVGTCVPVHVKLVVGCAFASMHVLVSCAAPSLLEMLSRAVLYYVLCALIVLCAPLSPVEKSPHCVLPLCAPVLFVHVYPLIASVLVIVGMHVSDL